MQKHTRVCWFLETTKDSVKGRNLDKIVECGSAEFGNCSRWSPLVAMEYGVFDPT